MRPRALKLLAWLALLFAAAMLQAPLEAAGHPKIPAHPKSDPAAPCGADSVLFHIAETEGRGIPGVQVQAISRTGNVDLGQTNKLGQICVSESVIFDESVQCVLFCREGFYCGAFTPRTERKGFRERLLALAPREAI